MPRYPPQRDVASVSLGAARPLRRRGPSLVVGSLLEVRARTHGNRHTPFERVRVHESDDLRALRIERGGELLTIDLDEYDAQPAPALPPAALAFECGGVGRKPPDAATAHPSLLSAAASQGKDWTTLAAWYAAGAASTVADPPAPAAARAHLERARAFIVYGAEGDALWAPFFAAEAERAHCKRGLDGPCRMVCRRRRQHRRGPTRASSCPRSP